MYSWTLAFLCASLLINAATASFALSHHQFHTTLYHNTGADSDIPRFFRSNFITNILSQAHKRQRPRPQFEFRPRRYRTRINSQFSDVRFSSVALAARKEETRLAILQYRPGQPHGMMQAKTYRQRRRNGSAVRETSALLFIYVSEIPVPWSSPIVYRIDIARGIADRSLYCSVLGMRMRGGRFLVR